MIRVDLELEHFFDGKFMGRKRYKPDSSVIVLGQTRDCGIQLLGDGVSTLHAVVDYQEGVWSISDLGSEQGTWVKKKPIVSQELKAATTVKIGKHTLKLVPKKIESHLFQDGKSKEVEKIPLRGDEKKFHQVIVRKNSFVVSAELLHPQEKFAYHGKDKVHVFEPPKNDKWTKEEFGDVTVQRRLVDSKVYQETSVEKMETFWDPNLKGPMATALIFLLILGGLVALNPTAPEDELEELKPENNVYSKMIYDAKSIRKRRTEAKKIRHSITQSNKELAAPTKSKQLKVNPDQAKSAKVATKIKASGLSKLIGKISKRASKSAVLIQAKGKTADSKSTGRAAASLGNVSDKIVKSKKSFKLGSVKTAGKAGGSSSYKNVGGLALGNVGSASVGILEEETEIQGGLDKDIIAGIIEKNLGQIRYCYERQLSAAPDLYGKVMVKFVIGAAGSVISQLVGTTTLKSAMVEGCILRRISGWQFPKPRGGTQVRVTYPFLFKSTN